MRVVVAFPPWLDTYGRFASAAKVGCVTVPLGICYLGAALKEAGHDVVLLDAQTDALGVKETAARIIELQPDVVGLSATTPIYHNAEAIARLVKEKLDVPHVLGGVHPTVTKEAVFDGGTAFDYALIGEGERAFPEILDAIAGKRSISSVAGAVYIENGKTVANMAAPLIQDLDSLPFPARTMLPYKKYQRAIPGVGLRTYTDFFTSRGCPFPCTFCSAHTTAGRNIRWRSIEKVLDELEEITVGLGIQHIAIMDENVAINRERVMAFSQGVIDRKLKFTWEGFTHAGTVDMEILKALKRSGMVRISFGIESGNPEILKSTKKGVTLDQIRKAYDMAAEIGLERRGSAIIGHAGETKATAMDTINFCASLKNCQQLYLNIATPYPGTELWDAAVNGTGGVRLLTRDFSKYQRYGQPVIEVNDLNAADLIRLQKYGLRKFYMKPSRMLYNLQRAGIGTGLKHAWAFARGLMKS